MPNVSRVGTLVVSSIEMDVNFDRRQEQLFFLACEVLLLWGIFSPHHPVNIPTSYGLIAFGTLCIDGKARVTFGCRWVVPLMSPDSCFRAWGQVVETTDNG